jgi:hypothetical protein
LAFAVHQAAIFPADPRSNHTEDVKRIARYQIGTVEKGIIMSPSEHLFEMYMDANFGAMEQRRLIRQASYC